MQCLDCGVEVVAGLLLVNHKSKYGVVKGYKGTPPRGDGLDILGLLLKNFGTTPVPSGGATGRG